MKRIALALIGMLSLFSIAYAAEDVGIVDLTFCDGSNHLVMTLASGQDTAEICMTITNKGTQTATISLGFVEGEVSQGDRPTQACKTSPDGFFGKSVTLSGESNVTLAPRETIQKYASFVKITGYVGELHGCMAYSVVDAEAQKTNAPMAIVTRKANLIDIIIPGVAVSNFYFIPLRSVPGNETKVFEAYGEEVGGDDKVKLFYSRDEQVLRVLMGIKNDGFVDEDYKVDIQFSSLLGLVRWEDKGNESQLYAQASAMADHVSMLPWYHLFVSADVGVMHRPQPIGTAPAGEWQKLEYNYSFLLVPRYALAAGGVVLLLLIWFIIYMIRRAIRRSRLRKQQAVAPVTATRERTVATKPRAPRKAPAKKVAVTAPAKKPRAKKPTAE